jgi:mRNA-degrading endonuclease toxin of MazEF toxin-antitoxin module
MNKRKWEIWMYDFPVKGLHPVVVISHSDRCQRSSLLNVLYCTSQRQSRSIRPTEVMLNSADGLSWETFVDCDLIYLVESAALRDRRGRVCRERRMEIWRKMTGIYGSVADD